MRTPLFFVIWLVVGAARFRGRGGGRQRLHFLCRLRRAAICRAGTAWNILGGYCGYVNFGSAAFFALGAYSTVAIYKFASAADPILLWSAARYRASSGLAWAI